MILILVPWGIINLAALLIFVEYMKNTDCWFNYFVYPWIDEWLDREKIGPFGKVFMLTLIILFFLPAFVVYYTIFTIYIYIYIIRLDDLFVSRVAKAQKTKEAKII